MASINEITHLHLYMNNPSEGLRDGTEISAGDGTLPLTFLLEVNTAGTKCQLCAVRCDEGFYVNGTTTILKEGTSAGKWKFAYISSNFVTAEEALENAEWLDTLDIANVADTNKTFWVKATTATTDAVVSDTSVQIIATGLVCQVSEGTPSEGGESSPSTEGGETSSSEGSEGGE